MGKIIIEAASYAELLALVQGMGGGSIHSAVADGRAVALASGEDGPEETGPVNTSAPAFDAAGLPWDERIHSSTKELNGDGKWRARRKSKGQPDDATVAAVEAELRARGGAVASTPAMPVETQQPVMMMQTPAPQMMQTAPMVMQQPMQMQPVQQTPAPMQTQPVAPVQQQQPMDFSMFMQHLSKGFTVAGADGQALINQHYMAQLAAHFQLSAITDLSQRPDLIPNVVAQVQADGRWIN